MKLCPFRSPSETHHTHNETNIVYIYIEWMLSKSRPYIYHDKIELILNLITLPIKQLI